MTNAEKDMLCAECGTVFDVPDERVPYLSENDVIKLLKEQKNEY